jgi:hypothetical protein
MDTKQFDDLAAVSIYHYCDCAIEKRAKAAAKRLAKAGVIKGLDDAATAYEKYEEMVVDYALDHLPEGYEVRHDYWGAKMISNDHGWRDPKSGLYAGDAMLRMMFFHNFKALEEYTNEKLELIQHEQDVAARDID